MNTAFSEMTSTRPTRRNPRPAWLLNDNQEACDNRERNAIDKCIFGDASGAIWDYKSVTSPANFPNAVLGQVEYEYDQRIGLKYWDFSGAEFFQDLGGLHIKQENVDLTPGTSGLWKFTATKN